MKHITLTKVIAETRQHADIDTRKSDRERNTSSQAIRWAENKPTLVRKLHTKTVGVIYIKVC